MKNFKDMLKDLRENEELVREAAAAFDSGDIAAIVAFGKAHGYEFTEEDVHFQRAAGREMDDNELEMVSGGSCSSLSGDCLDLSRCLGNIDCRKNAYSECRGSDFCSNNASGKCNYSSKY